MLCSRVPPGRSCTATTPISPGLGEGTAMPLGDPLPLSKTNVSVLCRPSAEAERAQDGA